MTTPESHESDLQKLQHNHYLEHGAGVLRIGGSVPEIAGKEAPGNGVARVRQQSLPLKIHAVLLVPLRTRPAHHNNSV